MPTEHYFTESPKAGHRIKKLHFIINNRRFIFYTDRGMFSKDRIDPGTKLLIEVVLDIGVYGERILDLGCGYGVIGIVMSPYVKEVIMCDINERAIKMAKRNIAVNRVDNAVVVKSDLYSKIDDLEFDLVLTNPPIRAGKALLHRMVDETYSHLCINGRFYMVIRTKQGAESMRRYIAKVFGNCDICGRRSGYKVLAAFKP